MRLHFQSYGAGFPLIILHGLFGSLDNWQIISRKLGETFHVFAVDLRNHGGSPHSDEAGYAAMVEDLREFMETHELARAHWLGHSMGGKTAMHMALRHPDLVEKLIVVDMAPREYPPWQQPIFEALLALNLGKFRERSEIVEALGGPIPKLAMRQFLVKNITRDENGAFRWKMNLPALYRNYDELRGAVESEQPFGGPVLFIKGGRSEHLLEGDMALISRLFPRTTIKTVPEAGHWVHADAAESVVKIVITFLS